MERLLQACLLYTSFIHGKGEGVLRKAVWDLIHRKFPRHDLQDASFQEYVFGATQVTIR